MGDMLKLRTFIDLWAPPTLPLQKPPFNQIKRKAPPFKPSSPFNVGGAGPCMWVCLCYGGLFFFAVYCVG